MRHRAVITAWLLTAAVALVHAAGCNRLTLRGREDPRPVSPERLERIQQISERRRPPSTGAITPAPGPICSCSSGRSRNRPMPSSGWARSRCIRGSWRKPSDTSTRRLARDRDYVERDARPGPDRDAARRRGDVTQAVRPGHLHRPSPPPGALLAQSRPWRRSARPTRRWRPISAPWRTTPTMSPRWRGSRRCSSRGASPTRRSPGSTRPPRWPRPTPRSWRSGAWRSWNLRHIPEAIADLKVAADRLPDRPDIYYNLALALEAGQQPADARSAAQQALRLAPMDAAVRQLSERLMR